MKAYDTVVVGAGPGGMTAVLYLCRFGLKVALVEKLTPGGQLLSTFEICNYPGVSDTTPGWSLAENFDNHLKSYKFDRYYEKVHSLSFRDGRHTIKLDNETLSSKTVIVCTGATPKKMGIHNEDQLTGRGVSYCAMCDGPLFKNKTVAMVGGGNAALEEALHLSNLVKKLYLIHRRDRFRADKIYQDKILERSDKIEPILGYTLITLHGEAALTGITVIPTEGGEPRNIEVTGLFVFIGTRPVGDFLPAELKKDAGGFVVTDCEMHTNIPGLFAAGDLRSKQCRQVVTAVGDGATAAYSAFAYIEQMPE